MPIAGNAVTVCLVRGSTNNSLPRCLKWEEKMIGDASGVNFAPLMSLNLIRAVCGFFLTSSFLGKAKTQAVLGPLGYVSFHSPVKRFSSQCMNTSSEFPGPRPQRWGQYGDQPGSFHCAQESSPERRSSLMVLSQKRSELFI